VEEEEEEEEGCEHTSEAQYAKKISIFRRIKDRYFYLYNFVFAYHPGIYLIF